jgi:hypothetical protein
MRRFSTLSGLRLACCLEDFAIEDICEQAREPAREGIICFFSDRDEALRWLGVK